MDQTTRTVADSMVEQVYQVRPEHLNGASRLFGGQLMAWIDEVAGLVAIRHSKGEVVTASVDNLRFIRGARQHDLIVLIGRITYVGNTSMEVRVDTYIEDLEGIRRPINRAYLTEVAINEDGSLRKAPGLTIQNESERAEWLAGERRKQLRTERRQEGF
ncbi:MAG: acyl-CoA thioesterase [Clostridiales bacterium]|nr:acyl-CoA thioesterase [Clostridiales bacterium]